MTRMGNWAWGSRWVPSEPRKGVEAAHTLTPTRRPAVLISLTRPGVARCAVRPVPPHVGPAFYGNSA
jgi:hypothetical protein